jgi:hypothetical protein
MREKANYIMGLTMRSAFVSRAAVLLLIGFCVSLPVSAQKHENEKPTAERSDLPALLWRDHGNTSALNLIYGAGGVEDAPDPNDAYTFEKEDMNGTSAKFYVKDSKGVEWLIKLGAEPESETAATRLVWAVGYFVDEDYYLSEIKVQGLPELHRGHNNIVNGNLVRDARLKRKNKDIKKLGNWDWFNNPFTGTRELNGLRVMMALINNWDLKEINNSIYAVDGEQRYVVTDLGASFGKTGNNISRSKGDPEGYAKSKFIAKAGPQDVDFEMHSRPFFLTAVNVPNYRERTKMEDIAKHIPRQDAKWIGQLLGKLSPQQLSDCFKSAGYTPEETAMYVTEVQKRIAELKAL